MSDRNDEFLRKVAANYTAPPMTASQRTRFDAHLEERVRDGFARPRPWLAGVAVAAAAAALLFWQTTSGVAPTRNEVASMGSADATLESDETSGEWILAMEGDVVADANAGLPADYVAISNLLLGE